MNDFTDVGVLVVVPTEEGEFPAVVLKGFFWVLPEETRIKLLDGWSNAIDKLKLDSEKVGNSSQELLYSEVPKPSENNIIEFPKKK